MLSAALLGASIDPGGRGYDERRRHCDESMLAGDVVRPVKDPVAGSSLPEQHHAPHLP